MELSKVSLEHHLNELRWVIQELSCVLPATNRNKDLSNSISECIERLTFALHNLDRNAKKLTNKKKKEKNCGTP